MFTISLPTRTVASAVPVCSTYHVRVDAPLAAACAALDELDPPARLARALGALCAGHADVTGSSSLGGERVFSLALRLEDADDVMAADGTVTMTWIVSLAGRGERASALSITSSVEADRAWAMDRMLDAWCLVGPAVEEQTRRIALALRDGAEELELV